MRVVRIIFIPCLLLLFILTYGVGAANAAPVTQQSTNSNGQATSYGYVHCPTHYYYVVEPMNLSVHHHPLLNSFALIATQYKTTAAAVAALNPLAVPYDPNLPIGMSMCIPDNT